ncbi:MAG: nucleotidyltransferase domain-containing protein [Acidobacteriota bacterium]
MAIKTASRKIQNGSDQPLPPGLPDLPWYRDAANGRKRNAHIKHLCEQIAREFSPEKIILFGSQAYGKPTVESDIDLLVVMPYEGSTFRQAGIILKQVIPQIGVLPIDLLVRTPEQISERLAIGDQFICEILERGNVMYEATEHRMKAEGRRRKASLQLQVI